MHSQTTSSFSESSIAYPNYKTSKRVANPKIEPSQTYCKSMGTNIFYPASITTSVSSEESTNFQYLHRDNCRHKFTTINNCRAMKGILKGKSLQRAAPQPDMLEANNEARGGLLRTYWSNESACSNNYSEPMEQLEAQPPTDDFLLEHSISFTNVLEPEAMSSQHSGSKRSSGDKLHIRQRAKQKQNENMNKDYSITIAECLAKLGSLQDISVEGILAVQDALLEHPDNRVIFMNWSSKILRRWIEHIIATHPRLHSASAWK